MPRLESYVYHPVAHELPHASDPRIRGACACPACATDTCRLGGRVPQRLRQRCLGRATESDGQLRPPTRLGEPYRSSRRALRACSPLREPADRAGGALSASVKKRPLLSDRSTLARDSYRYIDRIDKRISLACAHASPLYSGTITSSADMTFFVRKSRLKKCSN